MINWTISKKKRKKEEGSVLNTFFGRKHKVSDICFEIKISCMGLYEV